MVHEMFCTDDDKVIPWIAASKSSDQKERASHIWRLIQGIHLEKDIDNGLPH